VSQPRPKLPQRLKLLRSNPLRLSLIRIDGRDPWDVSVDDDSIHSGYRRKDIEIITKLQEVDELSDYVKLRLFLARQMALMKYNEVMSSKLNKA